MSTTDLGRRLKQARLDAKLTQKEAADRMNVTFQAISNYERGTTRIKAETLNDLCRIYGITISDLLRTPAWTKEMFDAYNAADDNERLYYIEKWGCPAELIEAENERREPDLSPLYAEDERLLYVIHRLPNASTAYALVEQLSQLNEEGQEKLLDYAVDLVASGRYIKSDSSRLGEKEA